MRGTFRRFKNVVVLLILAGLLVEQTVTDSSGVESTTIVSSSEEDSASPFDGVTFSNTTVLHIEDSALEVITRDLFRLHPELEELHLSGRVRSIAQDAFASMGRLSTLFLENNYLTSVPQGPFGELPSLKKLSLSNNQLEELKTSQFWGARELQWLSLGENTISSIQPGAFSELVNLAFLNLSCNALSTLDFAIPRMSPIQELHLDYNYVKGLYVTHLHTLIQLRVLSIRGNLLANLPTSTFTSVLGLRRLDLGDNFLRTLPRKLFSANRYLEELSLDSNMLESLPVELFQGLTKLRRLDIRNNRLKALPEGTFRDQPVFVQLALEGNRLERFEPTVLRSADVLLQNNRIRELKKLDAVLGDVRNLFLYGNEIATIEQDALEGLPGLELLYADNNRISELSAMLFRDSHQLLQASFSHNRLTVLRTNTFAGLRSLHSVDLSHNQLSVIEPNAFTGSPVEYLYLNDNRLKTLDVAVLDTRLLYLQADANEITSFGADASSGLPEDLMELSLNDNHIVSVEPLCSKRFAKLTALSLRNNALASMGTARCVENLLRKDAHEAEMELNLAANGFTEVPALAGRVDSLDLSGNNLTDFDGYQFRWYQRTETLLLRDTLLTKMSATCFTFLVHLKRLEIGSRVLESIDPDSFQSLQMLEHLEIIDSPLVELPAELLTGQSQLSVVSFSRNKISTLAGRFFLHCNRLESVDLSYNELTVADSAWFKGLERLKALYLAGNRLTTLPPDLLSVEQSLDMFSVAGNRLTATRDISFLANTPLQALNVSDNQLTEVEALERNDFVTQLDVSGNRLTGRLLVRGNFRVLIANSNNISTLEWPPVDEGGLTPKWELLWLELADNSLAEIDPRLFANAPKLTVLDVSENRLNRFPFEQLYRLKRLQVLSVARNNIRTVPQAVAFGFKLDTLDLSENPLEMRGPFLPNSSVILNLIDETI